MAAASGEFGQKKNRLIANEYLSTMVQQQQHSQEQQALRIGRGRQRPYKYNNNSNNNNSNGNGGGEDSETTGIGNNRLNQQFGSREQPLVPQVFR